MAIIRTNVLGYVIDSDPQNQRGTCCEYGTFPSQSYPNAEQVFGPGVFGREQFGFNGYVWNVGAAVKWDVAEANGQQYATNVRAQ